jgi:hypothetical protein
MRRPGVRTRLHKGEIKMGTIHKSVTPAVLAANSANSAASSGAGH